MNEIIYIIGSACLSVLIINAEPIRYLLTYFNLEDKKLFNCAMCFGTWIGLAIALVYSVELILVPIVAIVSSFIDKKLYE